MANAVNSNRYVMAKIIPIDENDRDIINKMYEALLIILTAKCRGNCQKLYQMHTLSICDGFDLLIYTHFDPNVHPVCIRAKIPSLLNVLKKQFEIHKNENYGKM